MFNKLQPQQQQQQQQQQQHAGGVDSAGLASKRPRTAPGSDSDPLEADPREGV
jgi:hypothetical protein